jgi:hypothetical protein
MQSISLRRVARKRLHEWRALNLETKVRTEESYKIGPVVGPKNRIDFASDFVM